MEKDSLNVFNPNAPTSLTRKKSKLNSSRSDKVSKVQNDASVMTEKPLLRTSLLLDGGEPKKQEN